MKKCLTAIIGAVILLTMIACSGGGGGGSAGPETTIYGTAATGAPVEGGIYIKDSTGMVRSAAIGDNGSFLIDVSDMEAPFILYAEGVSGTDVVRLYSVAYKAGRANVTSATTLVVAIALNAVPAEVWSLDNIRDESTLLTPPAEDSINNAKNNIVAIIGNGYSSGFDIMSGSFTADGTGFDALLDILDMNVTGGGKAGVSVSITDAITGEEYTSSNTVEASDVSSLGDIKSVRTLLFEYAGVEDNSGLVDDVEAVCATDIMENGKTGTDAFSELMVFDHKLDSSWTWGVDTTIIGSVEAVTLGSIGLGGSITIDSTTYNVDTSTTINDPGTGREAVCCLESFWVEIGEDRPGQDYVFYYILEDGEWKYWGNRALVTTKVYSENRYEETVISRINFELTGDDYANDPDYIFVTGDGIDSYVIYKKPSASVTGEYQYEYVSGLVNTLEVNSLVYNFTAVEIDGSTTLVPVAQWAMVCDGRPAGRYLEEDDFPGITVPDVISLTGDLTIDWSMPATSDCDYNPRVKIRINDEGGWRVTSNPDGTGSATYSYTDIDPDSTEWSPCEDYESGDALEAQVSVYDLQGVKYSGIKYVTLMTGK